MELYNIYGGQKFSQVFTKNNSCLSDGTIIDVPLEKMECANCGTVRTSTWLDWDNFYAETYSASRALDTPTIDHDKLISRSQYIYQWIESLIGKSQIKSFDNMLEIGCGQAYLLKKFPVSHKHGIEPGFSSYKEAKKSCTNVRNIGVNDIMDGEKYDFVMSYCVIEHLQKPQQMLEKVYSILNDGGKMLIALPAQDEFNYDLLFLDHIHHFSSKTFDTFLVNNGFKSIKNSLGSWHYFNIAMFFCEKTAKENGDYSFIKNKNISRVESLLEGLELIYDKYKDKGLYAFGFGEIAKTVIPYTRLDPIIIKYIDDFNVDPRVISTCEAKTMDNIKDILLLVNPSHIRAVKKLFSSSINFENPFSEVCVSEVA